MNLARRSITSSIYNIAANIAALIFGFITSIFLARLLEPDVFGVFAFVHSIVTLTIALPEFGFAAAFMHRTGGEGVVSEEILRVYFTLKLIFSTIWAIAMTTGVLLLAPATSRWVFYIFIAATYVSQQTTVVNVLLARRVQFRRLAIAQVVTAAATPCVSLLLAWYGWGLWALLAGKIVSVIVDVLVLYVIRPVWRPRLGWSAELTRYFIGFGSKVFGTTLLTQALDRVDDIWTGIFLGDRALGFYDKSYSFATYPRAVLSAPVTQVVAGSYSELRDDRPRLSQMFSWVNILLSRANFWVAALIWLIAPEFIRLALGVKWLPILMPFRLMLVYTLFDPIKSMIGSLLIICGVPQRVIRTRIIQLLVMILGLFTLGPWLGIVGVALAVDLMLVVGMTIFYIEARRFVDFSVARFFNIPVLAMGIGLAGVQITLTCCKLGENDWLNAGVKIALFSTLYAGLLAVCEGRQLLEMLHKLWQVYRNKKGR